MARAGGGEMRRREGRSVSGVGEVKYRLRARVCNISATSKSWGRGKEEGMQKGNPVVRNLGRRVEESKKEEGMTGGALARVVAEEYGRGTE